MKPDRDGLLIVFEGIDGAGKTTQLSLLASTLKQLGQDPVCSKEPTSGPWGLKIRQSASTGRMVLDEELRAFLEDRKQHVETLIGPQLLAGKIVLLDRYYLSTIAYQGARGADYVSIANQMKASFPVPDVTFILDVDPAISLHRIATSRGDVPNEFEKADELGRARRIFKTLEDANTRIIDGHESIPAIYSKILSELMMGPLRTRLCAKAYGCDDTLHCMFRSSGTCAWQNARSMLMIT